MTGMDMSDIKLSEGTTYILVIDTDKYSGNFERQLCGYATGIYDEERYHGQHEAEDARASSPELTESMEEKRMWVTHSDYGQVSNSIRATPGRLNDGSGNHKDAMQDERGWPAYESVAVFFEKPLNVQEFKFVQERVKLYGEKNGIGIKNVYMIKAVILPVQETLVCI